MIEICRFCKHGQVVGLEIDTNSYKFCRIDDMMCRLNPEPIQVQKYDHCGHFEPIEDWISWLDAFELAIKIASEEFGLSTKYNQITLKPNSPYAIVIFTPENRIIRAMPFAVKEPGRSYELWDFQEKEKMSQIPVVMKMDLMAENKFSLDAEIKETCYARTWTEYRRCLYRLLSL